MVVFWSLLIICHCDPLHLMILLLDIIDDIPLVSNNDRATPHGCFLDPSNYLSLRSITCDDTKMGERILVLTTH